MKSPGGAPFGRFDPLIGGSNPLKAIADLLTRSSDPRESLPDLLKGLGDLLKAMFRLRKVPPTS